MVQNTIQQAHHHEHRREIPAITTQLLLTPKQTVQTPQPQHRKIRLQLHARHETNHIQPQQNINRKDNTATATHQPDKL